MGLILEHLVKDHGISLAQAKQALVGWELHPMMFEGAEIGEYMAKGNEIHFALYPSSRLKLGRTRMMKTVILGLIEKYGFLVTRLYRHDKNKRLVERFGFRQTHQDEQYVYYWLDEETYNDCNRNTKA